MADTRALYISRLETAVRELEAGLSERDGDKPLAERLAHNRRLRQARLRLAKTKGTHTTGDWEAIVAETAGICVRCGYQHVMPHEKPVKARVVPLALGGSDGIENIQPLCRRCAGASDGVNYLAQWRAEQGSP